LLLTLGALLSAWGLWGLYIGVTNYQPESELPRWVAFPFAAILLALGIGLVFAGRSLRRRETRR